MPIALAFALALAGCKVELYSSLNERQANAMLSTLQEGGVHSEKKAGGKETFSVIVEESDLALAVSLLDAAGLPGDRFAAMADLYKKEGLISSPMEERVRYMFALSQSIAETLTNIDGVLTARVHIALPENDKFSGEVRPTSASVFIKHHRDHDFDDRKSDIKRVVESSIEGLDYENIAVFTSPSAAVRQRSETDMLVSYGPFDMSASSVRTLQYLLLLVTMTLSALVASVLWLLARAGTLSSVLQDLMRWKRAGFPLPDVRVWLRQRLDRAGGADGRLLRLRRRGDESA